MTAQSKPPIPLAEIIVQPEPSPPLDRQAAESEGLLALSETLANRPDAAVQRLVETAMKLAAGDSAGISLEEQAGEEKILRWVATCGEFSPYLNGTIPRDASPCGAVLDRGCPLVMRDPARHYESIRQFQMPIRFALLVPFGRGGKLIGTVWVIRHRSDSCFSSADVRIVQALTTFSTSMLDVIFKKK